MTLDDFEVGMRVKHKEHGEGIVERKGKVLILIKYGADMYKYHYPFNNLTIIEQPIVSMKQARKSALQNFSGRTLEFKQPISKMETTEEKTMHTIDDFKIGTRVKHEKYGEGVVVAISFYQGMIKVVFDNGETGYYYYTVAKYLDLLSELTIIEQPISKMETTEEKMQEFDPITKENINEVLEYNGWKYDGENYNHYQSTKDGFVVDYTILLADFKFKFNYYLRSEYGNIQTDDFNEFLIFVQKRVDLKPLPKFEFDFKQYLLDNGSATKDEYLWVTIKNDITVWIFNNHFALSVNSTTYAKTKENADILIAATKVLEGLK